MTAPLLTQTRNKPLALREKTSRLKSLDGGYLFFHPGGPCTGSAGGAREGSSKRLEAFLPSGKGGTTPAKEAITPQKGWDFARIDTIRRAAEANLLVGADDDRFPVYPQRLVAEVRRAMPSDGIIALDNGVYKLWFARNYKAHVPNSVLLDNALATMGAGLPSAMAARLVHPDRKIMAICGDGGFMMNSQELETAVRLGMQLVVLILRDDAYGMIRWKQANMGLPDFGLTYGNPDFVRYVESYGGRGHRVSSAAELGPLLAECLAAPGVHLIDCPVDYSENDAVLNREIKRLSAAI